MKKNKKHYLQIISILICFSFGCENIDKTEKNNEVDSAIIFSKWETFKYMYTNRNNPNFQNSLFDSSGIEYTFPNVVNLNGRDSFFIFYPTNYFIEVPVFMVITTDNLEIQKWDTIVIGEVLSGETIKVDNLKQYQWTIIIGKVQNGNKESYQRRNF